MLRIMSGWSIHIPMRMYNKCENASIAQWLVQLTCNEQVVGSNPTRGSKYRGVIAIGS